MIQRIVTSVTFCLLLAGCGLMTDQLSADVKTGQSKLEAEVQAVAPALGPWGALAVAGATLATAVFGAFHAQQANKQTDPPDDKPKPPTA
jgi:hypothetical protein